MKTYGKTQANLIKIAAVLMLITLLYNVASIEYSDLSWNTNKPTYRNIFLCLTILIAIYLDHKRWFKKQDEQ